MIPIAKAEEPVVIFTRPDTTVTVQSELRKEEAVVIAAKTDTVVSIKADTVAVILPVIKNEEPVVITAKQDTVVAIKADTVAVVLPEIKKEDPVVIIAKPDTVVAIKADTIAVVQAEIKKEEPVVIAAKADTVFTVKTDTVVVVQPEIKKEEPVVVAAIKDTVVAVNEKVKLKSVKPDEKEKGNNNINPVLFTPCKEEATGDDFLGLLKKMDKAKTENEKLFLAHKGFAIRCYNTKQIERISLQFTDDSGRYKLFDDAYQYVTDRESFPRLVELLKDAYYINRFKAMLR